jgi:hypothetical protein
MKSWISPAVKDEPPPSPLAGGRMRASLASSRSISTCYWPVSQSHDCVERL